MCVLQPRQLWSGKGPGLTKLARPNRQRQISPLSSQKTAELQIFSTCLALRRAQRIEREVREAGESRAACAQGSKRQRAATPRWRRRRCIVSKCPLSEPRLACRTTAPVVVRYKFVNALPVTRCSPHPSIVWIVKPPHLSRPPFRNHHSVWE